MSPRRGLLPVAVLLMQLMTSLQTDDVPCATNLCPNQEHCLRRDGPGNISFVCECVPILGNNNNVMGHDCSKSSDGVFRTFNSCYGNSCRSGSFASPNYPNNYNDRDRILMTLYIPHATYIHFEFASPFGIEKGRDGLYVGKGLEVYFEDLDEPEYIFDGDRVPSNFTLDTDTAWLLFEADASTTKKGFNISWTSEVDFEAPEVTFCPPDQYLFVRQGIKNQKITWGEPGVKASENYTTTKNAPSDGIFPLGTTSVKYRFADVYENDAQCEFAITIIVDDVPPVFYGCPSDLSRNVTLPTHSLNISWVEPFAVDNSNMSLIINTTLRPGIVLGGGVHEVDYIATDPFGNQGHCNFQINITVLEKGEPPRAIFNELLPLVICGALFTIISCLCCLGRSVKSGKHLDTVSRSNQQNNSTEPRSSSTFRPKVKSGEESLNSSTDTRGLTSSSSEKPNSISLSVSEGSSGFISGSGSQNSNSLNEENEPPAFSEAIDSSEI